MARLTTLTRLLRPTRLGWMASGTTGSSGSDRLLEPGGYRLLDTGGYRLLEDSRLEQIKALSGISGIYTLDEFATDGQRIAYEDSAGVTPASAGGVCGLLMDQSQIINTAIALGTLTNGAAYPCESFSISPTVALVNTSSYGQAIYNNNIASLLPVGAAVEITINGLSNDRAISVVFQDTPTGAGTGSSTGATIPIGENRRVSFVFVRTRPAAMYLQFTLPDAVSTTASFTAVSARTTAAGGAYSSTTANKSTLRQTPTSAVRWLDAATATAAMTVTLPSAITNATVFDATPTGVTKTTGVNLGSSYSLTSPYTWFSGRVVIDAAVHGATTAAEDALITRWLSNYVPQLGANLVTNGTFDTDTTGWTSAASTLSVDAGRLKITQPGGSTAYAYQYFAPGEYLLSAEFTKNTTAGRIFIGNGAVTTLGAVKTLVSSGTYTLVAQTTGNAHAALASFASAENFCFFDNVSFTRIL